MREAPKPGEAEAALLIACVSQKHPEICALAEGRVNWDLFMKMAGWHSCIPQVYSALKATSGIPEAARTALRAEFVGNRLKNTVKARELANLVTQLRESGIESLAIKGPALAMMLYGDATTRQFSDLDVLVRSVDAPRAADVLESRNYVPRRF
ncbi:MAG TPA: nucleotidyltransferase family protein, partial [Candidatus Binataceae bacterium]|nr:nucleotidyltransferase family protein [Candidatus Binataceae bacterium]